MGRSIRRVVGRDLRGALDDDIAASGLEAPVDDRSPVSGADLSELPDVVQGYLHATGTVGRAPVRSLRSHFRGEFRMRPNQRFMRCETWQYNSARPVARLFHMRIDFLGLVPMVGSDRYIGGQGRMLGKLLGLVTVADGSGPEFDAGELVTFLNDAVFFAPSMLLTLDVGWEAVDDRSFDVTLTDAGRTVRARVFLGDDGLPSDFSTEDRYADLPEGLVRTRWSTPISGWAERTDGRLMPAVGEAIWHLPAGEFTYARLRFDPESIDLNV